MNEAAGTFLLNISIKIAILVLLGAFWWPIRGEKYGKSLPLLIGLGILWYIIGHVVNPTLVPSFLQSIRTSGTPADLRWIYLIWSLCELFFVLLLVTVILSDATNLLPADVKSRSRLFGFLESFYRRLGIVSVALGILCILPTILLLGYLKTR